VWLPQPLWKGASLTNSAKNIGLDVRKRKSIAVPNSAGKVVMVETKASTILQFLRGLRGALHVIFAWWELLSEKPLSLEREPKSSVGPGQAY
jgi:hypothetical protein